MVEQDRLRRNLAKSKLMKRAARGLLQAEGFSSRDAATFAPFMGDIWGTMPEPQIKALLIAGAADMTITEDERHEARTLLRMTTTALTRKQRRQLMAYLYSDTE